MSKLVYFTILNLNNLEGLLTSIKCFCDEDPNLYFLFFTIKSLENNITQLCDKLYLKNRYIVPVKLSSQYHSEYLRLEIFERTELKNIDKILFIDHNYLVTRKINEIFDNFHLNDSDKCLVYNFDNLDNYSDPYKDIKLGLQTDGLLLFKNCSLVRDIFKNIIQKIKSRHTFSDKQLIISETYEKNIFSLEKLSKFISEKKEIKNLTKTSFFENSKNFIKELLTSKKEKNESTESQIKNKKYSWKHYGINVCGFIQFLPDNKLLTAWSEGSYKINIDSVEATWNGVLHILKFSKDNSHFISLRNNDCHLSSGEIIH